MFTMMAYFHVARELSPLLIPIVMFVAFTAANLVAMFVTGQK
ncbi:MAG: hypothetical protein R3C11_07685 [Planctomycetaceae bacterium]